jgi:glycosyltransferase involved in cell wall biosynthesis
MKKICVIITKLELGGAQKLALFTATHLDKNEFDVFMISGVGGILDIEASKSLRLLQLPNFVREISPLKDLKALIEIWKILKRESPAVVHTHSSKAGILGRIAAKLAGVKMIVHTVHGYSFNERQKPLKKYIYVFLEKFCALFCNKLICVAKEDVKKGLRYKIAKENKFIVIRAGIDVGYFKNFSPIKNLRETFIKNPDTKVISTIGPFKPQKNLLDFIRVAAIVLKEIPNTVFVIVGDGQMRDQIENLISQLNLKDKILLLGWRTDIAEILYASDIFLMTSLWEGLPCSIVEAMCCAKPVIANSVDGVKEIIKDTKTGFQINPYDINDSAKKTIFLLKNNSDLAKIAQAAKQSITDEFDLNFVVKQHEQLYKS